VTDEAGGRLSSLQLGIAEAFFALPESVGFLLAGGGALIAQGLIDRPTDDLDFFANHNSGSVAAAGEALMSDVRDRGWSADVVRSGPDFRRLKVWRGGEDHEAVYVDLAVDSPPTHPPTITIAGPAFAASELAVRKTLALFGRAEPRDFADVHALHQRFERSEILRAAADADDGFDLRVFVQMLRSHRRLRDEDFPPLSMPVDALRAYFDAWADELDQ